MNDFYGEGSENEEWGSGGGGGGGGGVGTRLNGKLWDKGYILEL